MLTVLVNIQVTCMEKSTDSVDSYKERLSAINKQVSDLLLQKKDLQYIEYVMLFAPLLEEVARIELACEQQEFCLSGVLNETLVLLVDALANHDLSQTLKQNVSVKRIISVLFVYLLVQVSSDRSELSKMKSLKLLRDFSSAFLTTAHLTGSYEVEILAHLLADIASVVESVEMPPVTEEFALLFKRMEIVVNLLSNSGLDGLQAKLLAKEKREQEALQRFVNSLGRPVQRTQIGVNQSNVTVTEERRQAIYARYGNPKDIRW